MKKIIKLWLIFVLPIAVPVMLAMWFFDDDASIPDMFRDYFDNVKLI